MSGRLQRFVTADGVLFQAPDHLKTSPLKANAINNHDSRKHGIDISDRAKLDRRLQVDSSMGTSVLIDFEEFESDILPGLPAGARKFGKLSHRQRKKLFKTFSEAFEKYTPTNVSEDRLTETVVDLINSVNLPNGYRATTSCYKADLTDSTRSKVDAALYADGYAPRDGAPDWTHCRLYIEFKKNDTSYDPFDDRDGWNAESMTASRARVRAQLIAYAWNTFLYQHRTALFSMFIIGDCFRAMRWDRSGVIVSRKVNYVDDPEALLGFLWHFVQLDDAAQGLDPTARLIKENSKAFRLMGHFAQPNEDLDVDDWENAEITIPEIAAPVSASKRTRRLRGKAKDFLDDDAPLYDLDYADIDDDGMDRRVFKYVRQKFAESIKDWPLYKLTVGPDDRIFLVGKPIFKSSAMFGRATRGYVALDVRTRRFTFLEDSWRPFYVGVQPEGTYLEMFADDTRFVHPTMICHGDVAQQTLTSSYSAQRRRKALRAAIPRQAAPTTGTKRARETEAKVGEQQGADTSLRHHTHYRIVVKEVCLPFEKFTSTEQLLRLMFGCIRAHSYAYSVYKIMHRDISAGNVLILPKIVTTLDDDGVDVEIVQWEGFLTDWELAKPVVEKPSEDSARQPERTGTWQFMSVAYVAANWIRPIEVADELESFFHVTLFYAVRFLRNSLRSVNEFVLEYFDTFNGSDEGRIVCGALKTLTLRFGILEASNIPLRFLKKDGGEGNPLNELLKNLLRLFKGRYEYLQHLNVDIAKEKKVAKPAPSAASKSGIPPRRIARPDTSLDPWKAKRKHSIQSAESQASSSQSTSGELSPEARRSKELLDDHAEVLDLFEATVWNTESAVWDDTGVVDHDQLVNYDPRIRLIAWADSTRSTMGTKRFKASHDAEPSVALPLTDSVVGGPSKVDRKGKGRVQ
ncbi:hypothetical protein C8Q79DRAFT_1014073 [Trametes meyenii]|nr:hypothetical protein C8Q79DRAFT_1014073 [Trametes meyenii]